MLYITLALLEQLNLFLIYVKTCDMKPGPAEFDDQGQADISQPDHPDLRTVILYLIQKIHLLPPLKSIKPYRRKENLYLL